ncbi:ribonuclease II [Capsulimonas corticalis]|uniref:Ribonuclease II n=1 Tax=Capsulimonas corticalis TaxID=2219043 RepID=A0A402CR20_9BACT|nr:RNB domain-containing ribonuclease [Capsulimonas corticalis]BDI34433.1 ribonuclease II [Capsulimonas corticalis]
MSTFDLHAAARRAMLGAGFPIEFAPATLEQAQHPASVDDDGARDLRGLLWSSIDNPDSRDLDQVEVAEAQSDGSVRLMVGIADVDAFAPLGSPLDRAAAERTTTVYTGVENFPMLPRDLSEGATSLWDGQDRLAMVTELHVGPDGNVLESGIYRAWVRSRAKLSYDSVGAWLEGAPLVPEAIAATPGLAAQLRTQDAVSMHLRKVRLSAGALEFDTIEARPVLENGRVVDLAVTPRGHARYLIENFMVAANTAVSGFLQSHSFPSIQRIVRRPARWERIVELARPLGEALPAEPDAVALSGFLTRRKAADPDHFPDLCLSVVKLLGPGEYTVVPAGGDLGEHFGLAVYGYTHSTAPNRRYIDLVTQRLLKAACIDAPCPYSLDELTAIAAHCNERASAAQRVERILRKSAAAVLLHGRIGETFTAIVTGVKAQGTYVRLVAPPVEGRIMHGERGLDVGDRVHVRLTNVDPEQGFIDFERV